MKINLVFSFYYGFLFASFLSFGHLFTNRVKNAFYEKSRKQIHRKWKFILSGRSKCDHCNKPLNPLYIIPLFGYFFSGGKCTKCHKKISPVYVLEEWASFIYGSLFYLLYLNHFTVIFMLFYFLLCYFIARIDYSYFLIPTESLLIFFSVAILEKLVFRNQAGDLILLFSVPLTWYFLLRLIDRLLPGRLGLADTHYIVILTFASGFPKSVLLPTVAAFLAIFFFFIQHRSKNWDVLKTIKIPFGLYLSLAFLILKLIPIPYLIQ